MLDANGTRHHLLFTQENWAECEPKTNAAWVYNAERKAVILRPQPFVFPRHPSDPILTAADRRGAARDRYGHWYWIGDDHAHIQVRWSGAPAVDHYWPPAGQPVCPSGDSSFRPKAAETILGPEKLAGLATTKGHYLVAGSPDTGSLLLFDLHIGGAPPTRIRLPLAPGGVLSIPFDLAPLNDGGVVVLDRAHKILWILDATFRPVSLPELPPAQPLLFQPKDGPQHVQPGVSTFEPLALGDCDDPVSVEPIHDGSFLVLDLTPEACTIRRYVPGLAGVAGAVQLREENLRPPDSHPIELAPIVGHDLAFVPGETDGGTLFVVNTGGNQAFALTIATANGLTLRVQTKFYPLRSFTGKALVVPPGDPAAFYDQGGRWLPIASLPRQRYEVEAEIRLPVLDGRDPGCIWHRLCIDACIPPETSVQAYTRAADDADALTWQPWQPEPAFYPRRAGAEFAYYRLWSSEELRQPDTGTWELLFQNGRGRYLQVRLELTGNRRATPAIRALRAHYPRFSYLANYLPAHYQNDPVSASFLERFLANPEGMLTRLEGSIADVQVFFDARTTEAVDWLGSWLGLAFDPTWSDYQRRLLIAHAAYFFLRRGTLPGVMQAIRLALDPSPDIFQDAQDATCARVRIVERFRTRYNTSAVLGDPTAADTPLTGNPQMDAQARAHRFIVLLPASVTASQVALVEQVVNVEKPAHTDFIIRQYWAMFRVGEVRVGIDTTLGEGGWFELLCLDQTALAEGYLGEDYPDHLTDRTVLAL